MNLFNLFNKKKNISTVRPVNTGSHWQTIAEPYTGAWERNEELKLTDSLTSYAVFSCISLISKDVGKLSLNLKSEREGIKSDIKLDTITVINKPNKYQTRQQFFEAWINSKAGHGNTYALKVRDVYGSISELLILDPTKTTPCIAPNGDVFYQINIDLLTGITENLTVPSSEIIHDRYNCFYHPLVGLSPIVACNLAAATGMNIQSNAKEFFGNMSRPSGILVSPNSIEEEDAKAIKANWDKRYSKGGLGGTAVLGDGVTYQALSVPAADSQMLEHLKLSGEVVCSTFNIPSFKVGITTPPSGKIAELNEIYYSDCLQHYIEAIENLLNEHLELPENVVVEFNIKSLIRMDSTSQMSYLKEGTGSGILSPNEARAELGYKPVEGGDSPVMQQQNYSLSALSKRDAKEDPFNPSAAPTLEAPTVPSKVSEEDLATNTSNKALESVQSKLEAIYKGVFEDSKEYNLGDFVTKSGSLWHCNSKHLGSFNYDNFTLAVKKGEANNVTNS